MYDLEVEVEQEATDDSVGYIPKGYKLHDERILLCPSCNQKLLSAIVVKLDCPCIVFHGKEIDKMKLRAKCIKCNTYSFFTTFERCKIFYQAVEPKSIVDIDITDGGIITVEIQ